MSDPSPRKRHLSAGRVIMGVAVVFAVAACSEAVTGPSTPITDLPRTLSASEVALIDAGNDFAVDLLADVYASDPDSTVFLSPLSVSMALGMTMNGARGQTRDQIATMLGFGGMSQSDVNQAYADLLALLSGLDSRVQVDIANALFHRDSFAVETPFLDAVTTDFGAEVQGLDFDEAAAVTTINDWVRTQTQDRIEEIVTPPIDPATVMYLMNAIYFKGDWTKAFDPDDSYTGSFTESDGGTANVRFMSKEDTVAYRSDEEWVAVDLPYGGGAWAMTVALPRSGYSPADLVAEGRDILDPEALWESRVMTVEMPRFELEWSRVLNDNLRALGMVDALLPTADFTALYEPGGVYVTEVRQKTFLRVDEVGTEAAAVTSVEFGTTSVGDPSLFKADRPYLVAIRERLSGTVLFAGLILQAPVE